MRGRGLLLGLMAAGMLLRPNPAMLAEPSAETLFLDHCARCHGGGRLGGIGPALLPENLQRLSRNAAKAAIRDGLPSTQMPAFGSVLVDAEIDSLVEHIYTPLARLPTWGASEIAASRVVHRSGASPDNAPVHDADPLNLFLVVEAGDHHVSVLDGDTFEPIFRFESRYALHGGLKFSPEGRYVYLASRDGWISKFDLYRLELVVETRAGINTRNLAVSADGRYVAVANYLPHTLVLLAASDLSVLRIIEVADASGMGSRVSAVYDAPPRSSFIAALKDVREVWEIQYADEPVHYEIVHDYRDEGALEDDAAFPIRRIELDDYLDDFFFGPDYSYLVGAARDAKNGQVVNLHVGRKIASVDLSGLPHLGSGITWELDGRTVLATPNLEEGTVSIIDTSSWETIKRIETLGPGFFMRSHENSAYAWVDTSFGPNRDAVHVIDKSTLEIVATLRPAPGKTAAHVEFTRDGKYALLSISEREGAIVVYDAESLAEVKRIPMRKPSGKYNVYNKITRSSGTSH